MKSRNFIQQLRNKNANRSRLSQEYEGIESGHSQQTESLQRIVRQLQDEVYTALSSPNSQILQALTEYRSLLQHLEAVLAEKEAKLAKVKKVSQPVETVVNERDEKFVEELKANATESLETALKKIDAEEEKLVAQLKMKYLSMQIPAQSQSDGAYQEDEDSF